MSPQRRTALVSIVAAIALIAIKLGVGIASGSLGLLSEAAHSGTDLVAALLTFFAVGVAGRAADIAHPYGHGKAEHLSALAEASILVLLSGAIAFQAVRQVTGRVEPTVQAHWWAIAVIFVVMAIDTSRMVVSWRASRRYESAALEANAFHFGTDLAGTTAVLIGLVAVAAGFQRADAAAALFVAVLVFLSAARLIKRNVDVLMDRSPAGADEAARAAIAGLEPQVELRRLRMRHAAGRHFADVVIGVSSVEAVGQGHAAADAVERAVQEALPGSDVVVHVEPAAAVDVRDRAQAAALAVPRVREVHNVSVLAVGGGLEVSLHLKLPGDFRLDEAHAVAEEVERAIGEAVPAVRAVHTHLEPLTEEAGAREEPHADDARVRSIVRDELGGDPREVRFLNTDGGLAVFLTLALPPQATLAEAHGRASRVEARIHAECPTIDEVVVHTEP